MSQTRTDIDWQTIRERLKHIPGGEIWRSLEELAGDETFRAALQREFAPGIDVMQDPITRRHFLKLAAASLGMAGLTACVGAPAEQILPYVEEPELLVPGKPLHFATAHLLGGYATGTVVESHEGRPTKVEGNELHPGSLGASDVYMQASVLSLYDPDRAMHVLHDGERASWDDLESALNSTLQQSDGRLRILTPTVTSPTLIGQLRRVLDAYPRARWHQYEPVNWDNAYEGTRLTFGRPLETVYHVDQAAVILSLDADFLATPPGRLRYVHDFSERRRVAAENANMNRLYATYSTPTLTASMADHQWLLRPQEIVRFTRLLAQELGLDVMASGRLPEEIRAAVTAVAADLRAHRGRSVILAGMEQPPAVHTLAHMLNATLDNVGATVHYTQPVPLRVDNQIDSLRDLVQVMGAGDVDVLLIVGGNPVYTAPADLDFAAVLTNVPLTAHLRLYGDETSALCHWQLPRTHDLETWTDARAFDGTATVMQPLLQPLFENRSPHELLAMLLGPDRPEPREIVRQHWRDQYDGDDFEAYWHSALRSGVVPDSAYPPEDVTVQANVTPSADDGDEENLLALFRPDPSVWDGRFANNGWLQELPKPFTKLTWDNAALVGPALAEELTLKTEDVIRLQVALGEGETAKVLAPVFVLPGQARGCITLHLGYGRQSAGSVGQERGFNAYEVRPATAPWNAPIMALEKVDSTYELATTQSHHSMEGRNLVRVGMLATFRENPTFAQESGEELPSLYPDYEYEGYAWGMSIDLNTCIGCRACVVACQAENNIPVVGKEGVRQGREMHWIRVDDYFAGENLDAPRVYHQPVTCMHCEKAPCEPVCPVAATTHSAEGLNEMTYNRCVGTRYCSNNCPYKVRRFNFFDYSSGHDLLSLAYNPDVTVRERGVMEKCTYCVQRINQARSAARQEGRSIRDGEIQTACQQACPAGAIVFGDVSDPDTQVAQLKANPRNYGLLAELGTRPRTTYLAKLFNENEELGA